MRDWSWNPAENLILGVLRLFIRLEDGLLENRLTELIEGEEGLLTIIEYERFVFSLSAIDLGTEPTLLAKSIPHTHTPPTIQDLSPHVIWSSFVNFIRYLSSLSGSIKNQLKIPNTNGSCHK